jgi:hypothetical protein
MFPKRGIWKLDNQLERIVGGCNDRLNRPGEFDLDAYPIPFRNGMNFLHLCSAAKGACGGGTYADE